MALPFCRSFSNRTAILFFLSLILAGLLLHPALILAQAPGASAPQGVSETRHEHEQVIETTANAASGGQPDGQSSSSPHAGKKERAVLKANFDKIRNDAGELAKLVKSLQDEVDRANENLLLLGVIEKADKIEKLAKRIKGTARGI